MNAKREKWFEEWCERVKNAMVESLSNATPETAKEYDDRVEERMYRGKVWKGKK